MAHAHSRDRSGRHSAARPVRGRLDAPRRAALAALTAVAGSLALAAGTALAADLSDPTPRGGPTSRDGPMSHGEQRSRLLGRSVETVITSREVVRCRVPLVAGLAPSNAPWDPTYVGSFYGLGRPSYHGMRPALSVSNEAAATDCR